MRIAELGESGLIKLAAQQLAAATKGLPSPVVGIGDDAAVWRTPGGEVVLGTIDALIENVHFSLRTTSWYDLGWKTFAVNLSDIAAMGGRPRYALLSLGLRADTQTERIAEFYRGLSDVGSLCGAALIGGDMVAAPEAVAISLALYGEMPAGRDPLLRSLARPGDLVAVTGVMGSSAAGLRLMGAGAAQTEDELRLCLAHLRPTPRVNEGQALSAAGVRAAMDVSDGLAGDLEKLCRASGVGGSIRLECVPVDPALPRLFPNEWRELALAGGEDFELLFTAPTSVMESVLALRLDCGVTVIGEVFEGSGVTVAEYGSPITLRERGYDHFHV